MTWNLFDDPTPEERERDRRIDAINNAGSRALALVRQIEDVVREYADVETAGIGELRKLQTVIGATMNSLHRHAVDRDELKRQEWVR